MGGGRLLDLACCRTVGAGPWSLYLYGRRNLVTLERSSLMKERGNISLDSCTEYLK